MKELTIKHLTDFAQYCLDYYANNSEDLMSITLLCHKWNADQSKYAEDTIKTKVVFIRKVVEQLCFERSKVVINLGIRGKKTGEFTYYKHLFTYIAYIKLNEPITKLDQHINTERAKWNRSTIYHSIKVIKGLIEVKDNRTLKDLQRINELLTTLS